MISNFPTIANSQYPEMLQWRPSTLRLADHVYVAFTEQLISSLYCVLEEAAPDALSQLKHLPLSSIKRIIEAPDTYNQLTRFLRSEQNSLINYILCAVMAEKEKPSPGCLITPLWSCDGSFLVDRVGRPATYDSDGWRIGGSFDAPMVGGLVPIDHHSPFARKEMPVAEFRSVQYGAPSSFSRTEEASANEKITNAFAQIQVAAPTAAAFIVRYAKSIVARKRDGENIVFQSASRNAYIGQIVLLNPHASHVDAEYIAESLIHEATHSLLWRAEVLDHFLLDPGRDTGTVQSPWSGETVYYYTLLQACFVWYGIYWFWENMRKRPHVFSTKRMVALQQRAMHGFMQDSYARALMQGADNLKPGIIEVFLEMQKIIKTQ
ncbi:MAG: HEXXH motif-containing putative peptide modification protein [Hyphomicrobium sp.]